MLKERIPNINDVDLEDEDVLKQLIADCQGRGISPSHIKHVKYVKRFLVKSADNHITDAPTKTVKERKTSDVLRGITVWKWYFVTKIVMTYCEKNCSSDWAHF